MIKRGLEQGKKGSVYWHILPIYNSAGTIFERMDRMLFRTDFIRKKSNESDLRIYLSSGADIFYKSGDKPHNLRTETLSGCIIDECREQEKEIWSQVVMPMTSKHNAWCDFYSTPNGWDWFKDIYDLATIENPGGEWAAFHAPSTEAPWWTQEQIIQAKANMSEDEFAQEILAEFREVGKGKVYLSHGSHNQKTQNPFAVLGQDWSPHLPIIIGLDFNVGMMCWVLGQHKAGEFYFGDELVVKNTNTQEAAPLLVDKVKNHPAGVILVGDASGKSQKTSAAGQTDYSIILKAFKDAGVKNVRNLTPDSNPLVKDRINIVNARLRSANGEVHCWYHPTRCKNLKRDLERVSYKENTDGAILDKSDPELTHASDAFGYPIVFFSNEFSHKPGLLRVIQR